MSCQNACPDGNIFNCIQNNLTKCPDCSQFNPNNCEQCLQSTCPGCGKLNWNDCGNCMSDQIINSNCPFDNDFFNCTQSKCPSCDITDCDNCLEGNATTCPSCGIDSDGCSTCLETKCHEYGPLESCTLCGIVNELDPDFCKGFSSEKSCDDNTGFGNFGCCKWVDNGPSNGSSNGPSNGPSNDSTIIGIVVGSIITLGLLGMILYYSMRKRKR